MRVSHPNARASRRFKVEDNEVVLTCLANDYLDRITDTLSVTRTEYLEWSPEYARSRFEILLSLPEA